MAKFHYSPGKGTSWRSIRAYRVKSGDPGARGRQMGTIEYSQDSSRTGGIWSARGRGGYIGAFTSRADAAEAILADYKARGFTP